MTEHRRARSRSEALAEELAVEAERARRDLGVASASIGIWERGEHLLRTLVNAGEHGSNEKARPVDEIYPVHTFPALVRLLERQTPYCFGIGDPIDVASASLAASLGRETQAAAPIMVRGEVWGSLWVATAPGERALAIADIPRVVRAANEIARALAALD